MRSVAQQLKKREQVPEIHLDHMFMGDEKKGKTLAFLVAQCFAAVVPRRVDGRVDMSEADGVAS